MKAFHYVALAIVFFTSCQAVAVELFDAPPWQETQIYRGKDLVVYDEHLYLAKFWNRGEQPDVSPHVWTPVSINGLPPAWSRHEVYRHGDAVFFHGKIYLAAWWTIWLEPGSLSPWGPWVYLGEADLTGPEVALISPEPGEPLTNEYQPVIVQVTDAHLSQEPADYRVTSTKNTEFALEWLEDNLIIKPLSPWADGEFTLVVKAKDTWGNQSEAQFSLLAEISVPIQSEIIAVPASGEAPLKVLFSPNITTDKAINYYRWDFDGDGVFDRQDTVGRSQSYTFNMPGTYQTALEITDSIGRKDTGYIDIEVENAAPVVSATVNQTNGHVPLTVQFTASATDNEGIASVAWDFNGDGQVDTTSDTAGTVSFTFEQVGNFQASVSVTDTLGKQTRVALPNIEIRAVDPDSPTARVSLDNPAGDAPLTVTLTPAVTNRDLVAVQDLLWDFDGDGLTDEITSTLDPVQWVYKSAGTFFPTLTVQFSDGSSAKDVQQVTVQESLSLSIIGNSIDPTAGQAARVKTVISANLYLTVQIEDRLGQIVRTLVPWQEREAGTYEDIWNGLDAQGQPLPQGDYYAVLNYRKDGRVVRFDLRPSTSGAAYNPSRSRIPSTFEPYNNKPLVIEFTLNKPSEVTAFMGLFNTNTRLVTFKNREPLGKGKHRIVWSGLGDDGKPVVTTSSNKFLFGIWGYSMGDNTIFLSSGPVLNSFKAQPSIVVPNTHTETSDGNSHLSFSLNKPADIELRVSDIDTGALVRRQIFSNVAAGSQQLVWDAKADDGNSVAPGKYRLGIRAIDPQGYVSPYLYTVQRVYY
ncbi:FlgD immunoglobulin-like domain containing protein [Photobacterium sp. WH80]|nr:FlgD immunoglobulin-like domain containing protein [Photobacterium sp. WH80]